MAVLWATSLSAVVLAAGSAYDYSKVTTARVQSVATADMLALSAAVYIRDHDGETPNTNKEGFKHNQRYYLEDIGIDITPYADRKAKFRGKKGRNKDLEKPNFRIKYDHPETGMVSAFVYGQTRPAFMGIVGIDNVDFSASSTVSYETQDLKDPASIGLVLDNSGSMAWDDGTGTIRMTGLKTTVKGFMVQMDDVIDMATAEDNPGQGQANATNQNKYLRTNMITYAVKNKNNGQSYQDIDEERFKWSTISDSKIDAMVADGGTNSSGAMALMNYRMKDEPDTHEKKNGGNPLKYVLFMTDGVNNVTSNSNCRAAQGHWHYLHWNSWTLSHEDKSNSNGWYRVWAREYDEWGQYWSEQTICDEISSYDAATISSCGELKEQGSKIYSIGYALTINATDSEWKRAEVARANALLLGCATGPEYFKDAQNANSLNLAFESIGEDIVEDSIRIRY